MTAPGADNDLIVLVCPPGAELAPISHGATAYPPWREFGTRGRWLVRVPAETARLLCWNAGFWRAEDALQGAGVF